MTEKRFLKTKNIKTFVAITMGLLLVSMGMWTASAETPSQPLPPLHPAIPLLDADGNHVLSSGDSVSAETTCSTCHDTDFITAHGDHTDVGVVRMVPPGSGQNDSMWDGHNPESEMNCFMCHFDNPNNDARIEAYANGNPQQAATATLLGSGIVTQTAEIFTWNAAAFDDDGNLLPDFITIRDPNNQHCAQCHGEIHSDPMTQFVTTGCDDNAWQTLTTGEIISPQRLSDSGTNLAGKGDLSRSWDVHAERVVACTDCHYAANNPAYYSESPYTQPDHLTFDPRRLEISDYLQRPVHTFNPDPQCESCHDYDAAHDWLPYKDRHVNTISCQTCHIPKVYGAALSQVDWTVMNADGTPRQECRGIDGESGDLAAVITGFEPALLTRQMPDGRKLLAPYNLISAWYWAMGDGDEAVAQADIQAAWLTGDRYRDDVLALFDVNGDKHLDDTELLLDTAEKTTLIANHLVAVGVDNPHIVGEIQPYAINHTVTHGKWATKSCDSCHSDDSRITAALPLAGYMPNGVLPTFKDGDVHMMGTVNEVEGKLEYLPHTDSAESLYIIGHDSVTFVDWFGILAFFATVGGVLLHSGLRFNAARHGVHHQAKTKRVYMYTIYERLWHWLQTGAIMLLLFTGFIIHKPSMFGMFSFAYIVQIHNIVGFILLANASLSLFYHLASGEIKQYIPQPRGFFNQAITQTMFYVKGIFKGEEHPFEKSTRHKLNPLQQITYFGILNVLLPLQIITGVMIWGAQRWPGLTDRLGGLPFLGPFHSLVAWTFASFIVMHVYLTTTGHKPLAGIEAMIGGWDEVEVHS